MKSPVAQVLGLLVFFFLVSMVAVLGGWFTAQSVGSWYPSLVKPAGTPPSWLFGPVWTILYLMIAISGWWVWQGYPFEQVRIPLLFYFFQLVLNGIWSGLFFGLQNPLAGLFNIVLLWCLIGLTIYSFWQKSTLAGMLLVPYFLWVSYATWLNFGIWRLN